MKEYKFQSKPNDIRKIISLHISPYVIIMIIIINIVIYNVFYSQHHLYSFISL